MDYDFYYTVDFSGVKRWQDVHPTIKRDLEFPSYYGENLDSLWECLCKMDSAEITVTGLGNVSINKDCQSLLRYVLHVFDKIQFERYLPFFIFEDLCLLPSDTLNLFPRASQKFCPSYEFYYTVDFSNIKRWQDVHPTIKRDMKFPSYYGENLDAMWDCLSELDPSHITIKGIHSVSRNRDCQQELSSVIRIFDHAQNFLSRVDIVYED